MSDKNNKKRQITKSYVKPHKRKNPKSPGKHKVQGHYRETGKKTNVREHWREVGGAREKKGARARIGDFIKADEYGTSSHQTSVWHSTKQPKTADDRPTNYTVKIDEWHYNDKAYVSIKSSIGLEYMEKEFNDIEEAREWAYNKMEELSDSKSGGSRSQKDYTGVLNDKAIGYDNIQEVVDKHPDIGGQKEAVEYMRKYHPEWLEEWAKHGEL